MSHGNPLTSNEALGSIGDTLDAGLRAAFGQPDDAGSSGLSVLDELADRMGHRRSVLLRDEPNAPPPIVRPTGPGSAANGDRHPRYQIVGEIARGGIGVVMLGRDVDLGRDVAMKVLRADHCDRPAMVRRFVEEAQIAGQLQHPGILPVYELGLQDRRQPYFTMKLVRGQTLSALLAARPNVEHDRQRFLRIFAQVCEAMAYAHAKGVIHRDLKPSNIMVGAFGEVQVVDWGLAKVLSRDPASEETRAADYSRSGHEIQTIRSESSGAESVVGSIMGTPAYMSPEQARGETDRLDERADVFALGAILCEILTGSPPYAAGDGDPLHLAARCERRPAFERLDVCGADEDVVAISYRCLSAKLEERPRQAGAVATEINKYLESLERRAHEAALAAAEAAVRVAGERRARRLTLALAATFVLALATVGGGWAWVSEQTEERERLATQRMNEVLDSAGILLGQAKAARIGDQAPWAQAVAAGDHVSTLLHSGQVDAGAAKRAEEFLAQLKKADADHHMIERIEEVVIVGATHEDMDSWVWMEGALRAAFQEYGIDLERLSKEDVGNRILVSDMPARLADGLELWIATNFHLGDFGAARLKFDALLPWANVLYAADPDPFRTQLRKLLYSERPDVEKLRTLEGSARIEDLAPRTLSWLGMAYVLGGDAERGLQVYDRASKIYPDDLMLNFDYAYQLMPLGKSREALPFLYRCTAIRPNVGGVWRKLGVALRDSGDAPASIDALRESIRLQPGHAPTLVDLGRSLMASGDLNGATEAFREAIRLKPNMPGAHGYLGRALQEMGLLTEALNELKRCEELAAQDKSWTEPSSDWVKSCDSLIRMATTQPVP